MNRARLAAAAAILLLVSPAAAGDPAPEADGLLREVQESRGGEAKLARIVSVRRQGELVVATAGGERRLPMEMTVRPPGTLELITGSGDERVRRVVEPGRAFQVVADGEATPLPEDEARRLRRLTLVDEAFLARFALAGELVVEGVEEAGPGQVAADLPAASGRKLRIRAGDDVRYGLVVPAGGGLPLRVDYQGAGGRSISDVFVNWRVVEDMLFPGEIIMFVGGQAAGVMRFESIEVELAPAP